MGGNLFGIGLGELLFLAILFLIIFGPRRIPEIARTLGGLVRQIRQVTGEFDDEVREWMEDVGTPEQWIEEGLRDRPPSVELRPASDAAPALATAFGQEANSSAEKDRVISHGEAALPAQEDHPPEEGEGPSEEEPSLPTLAG